MIPSAYIQAWSTKAPWADARQVGQDLIICRALCDLSNTPASKGKIAFRGGMRRVNLPFGNHDGDTEFSRDLETFSARSLRRNRCGIGAKSGCRFSG